MLSKLYPLLSFLSRQQLDELDLGVLSVPSVIDKALIDNLSILLDKYVVIYKNDYEPQKGHLCRLIKAAALDADEIRKVKAVERSLSGENNIIVVYEKPLTIH